LIITVRVLVDLPTPPPNAPTPTWAPWLAPPPAKPPPAERGLEEGVAAEPHSGAERAEGTPRREAAPRARVGEEGVAEEGVAAASEEIIRERVASAERLAEDLERVVVEPAGAEAAEAAAGASGPGRAGAVARRGPPRAVRAARIARGSTEPVVLGASRLVPEHLVRRRDLLEHHLRPPRIVGILVGVPAHRRLAIRLAYRLRRRPGVHAEQGVEILLIVRHLEAPRRDFRGLRWASYEAGPGRAETRGGRAGGTSARRGRAERLA
jgi:hypothetical protein